jgi:hypothetical protein
MSALRQVIACIPREGPKFGFLTLACDVRKSRHFIDIFETATEEIGQAPPCLSIGMRQLPDFLLALLEVELDLRRRGLQHTPRVAA